MSYNVPVLQWTQASFGAGHVSTVRADSAVSTSYLIALNGTDNNGNVARAQFVIIDNTGNNGVVYADYGVFQFSVAPYTRKTFPILKDQLYMYLLPSVGVVPCTFTTFDPGLPDDVNQVATGSATGGGTIIGTTFNAGDKNAGITLSSGNLVATSTAGGFIGARASAFKTAGLLYFEGTLTAGSGGFALANAAASLTTFFGADANSCSYFSDGNYRAGGVTVATGPTFVVGQTVRWAVNVNTLKWWAALPGQLWNNSGAADPATGAAGFTLPANCTPGITSFGSGASFTANFGSTPLLNTPPTGFTAGWPA